MSEHANVTTFVACDRVIEEAKTQKKTVIGIFQNFNLQTLPSRFGAPWFVFAQISNLDPGHVDVTINIVHDETQGVVFAAGIEVPDEHPPNVDVCLPAHATEFRKEGKYVVTLNINGSQSAYFVLNVSLLKQPIGG